MVFKNQRAGLCVLLLLAAVTNWCQATTFFRHHFEGNTVGLLTGQAADTGQVWTDSDLPTAYPSFLTSADYGWNYSMGAGPERDQGFNYAGNTVMLGTTLSSGRVRLEVDLQRQWHYYSGSGFGWHYVSLHDHANDELATVGWHANTGSIQWEGLGLPETPVDSGFGGVVGTIHLTIDIDLDSKEVSYSWYDNSDPTNASASGTVNVGTYTGAFAPDSIQLEARGNGLIAIGFDNLHLGDQTGTTINGQPYSSITIPASPHADIVTAAGNLAVYIQQMLGTAIPIRTEGDAFDPCGYHIRIGSTSEEPVAPALLTHALVGYDGFVIKSVADGVVIAGSTFDGTRNGVYHFAEKMLDVYWVSHEDNGPTCPHPGSITIPVLDMTVKPLDEWRGQYYSFQQYPTYSDLGEFATQLSINRDIWWYFNRTVGPAYISHSAGHAWLTIVPKDVYFDTHPEYFPLTDYTNFAPATTHLDPYTVRVHNLPFQRRCDNDFFQRNFGHPDVLQITIDYCRAIFDADPCATAGMGANDGPWWCMSPEFLALGPTDPHRMLAFINAVATANETLYPGRLHSFFAYDGVGTAHMFAPSGMTVHANAMPVIAPLRTNRINSILSDDPDSVYVRQAVESWGVAAARTGRYTYMNFGPFVTPGSASAVEEHRFLREHGCIGGMREYQHLPRVGWSMINWIDAQNMWDDEQDPVALRRKFIEVMYGNGAADSVENIYEQIETRLRATTPAQWSEPDGPNTKANEDPTFWRPLLPDWRSAMEQALRVARQQREPFRKRIERDMLIVAGIAKDGALTCYIDSTGDTYIWNTRIGPMTTDIWVLWSTETGSQVALDFGNILAGSPLGTSEKIFVGNLDPIPQESDLIFEYLDGGVYVEGAVVVVNAIPSSNPKPGDANLDGNVDSYDFRILAQNWLAMSGMTWHHGDFSLDNAVDLEDMLMLVINWLAE